MLNTEGILFTFPLIILRMEFSLHVRYSGFRNSESFASGKVLPAESGNMAFGIHNSTQGTLKPTNNGIWISSSTDRESRILHLEFGIQHRIQNPIPYLITLHTCRVTVLSTPPSSWISFTQVSLNNFLCSGETLLRDLRDLSF